MSDQAVPKSPNRDPSLADALAQVRVLTSEINRQLDVIEKEFVHKEGE